MESDLRDMLKYLQMKNFDTLRFWHARKKGIIEKHGVIDFFGSEYIMVKFLINIGLCNTRYECRLK